MSGKCVQTSVKLQYSIAVRVLPAYLWSQGLRVLGCNFYGTVHTINRKLIPLALPTSPADSAVKLLDNLLCNLRSVLAGPGDCTHDVILSLRSENESVCCTGLNRRACMRLTRMKRQHKPAQLSPGSVTLFPATPVRQ